MVFWSQDIFFEMLVFLEDLFLYMYIFKSTQIFSYNPFLFHLYLILNSIAHQY